MMSVSSVLCRIFYCVSDTKYFDEAFFDAVGWCRLTHLADNPFKIVNHCRASLPELISRSLS